MSLFRKPKKQIQRRVFSSANDDDPDSDDEEYGHQNGTRSDGLQQRKGPVKPKPTITPRKVKEKEEKSTKTSLLSFGDEDDDGEIFQVKKSSHSKKVMKQLDKERRRKKHRDEPVEKSNRIDSVPDRFGNGRTNSSTVSDDKKLSAQTATTSRYQFDRTDRPPKTIQTEIRTDDFVLVVKKSEPENLVLNGRAALCAGRDDMSSEEDDYDETRDSSGHCYTKPDAFRTMLQSGAIPDAAMIHAARKKRQKAREEGEFIPVEEKPVDNRKGRLIRDDGDDDVSDDEERVDMSAIMGTKERAERREQFYSVQKEYSGDESDAESNEWENQQIRKGVTGAQLVTAQQESSIYCQYMIKPSNDPDEPMSTGDLLEQAYARSSFEKPRQMMKAQQKSDMRKVTGPRTPDEVVNKITERLAQVRELNAKHVDDIDRLAKDLQIVKIEQLECEQNAPIAAGKYRFYQELRGYVTDLVECLDEKVPQIVELERKAIAIMSKQANTLIERRRQDVRDQAKEMTEIGKSGIAVRRMMDDEERVRRAAEREGRRTRRRRDRERVNIKNQHLDGMSSDDEIPDQDVVNNRQQIEQLMSEANCLFDDTTDEYSRTDAILDKFERWRQHDPRTYKDTYVSLCLPKIMGPMIRMNLLTWNPLQENAIDLERFDWFNVAMRYGWDEDETEESLMNDTDVRLVPTLIEKIVLPKLTELIEMCWDPMSSSQTLKLVGLISRLARDYPSVRATSESLRTMLMAILDKMKLSLDNDVFIPIFPKQMQEARTSFFQRQFCSGLKLFRNFLSWQGILADSALRDLAILSLLNRYLLSGMRVCTITDATSKAYIIVNTLPRVWLQEPTILDSLQLFIVFLRQIASKLNDSKPLHLGSYDKISQVLHSLHSSV